LIGGGYEKKLKKKLHNFSKEPEKLAKLETETLENETL